MGQPALALAAKLVSRAAAPRWTWRSRATHLASAFSTSSGTPSRGRSIPNSRYAETVGPIATAQGRGPKLARDVRQDGRHDQCPRSARHPPYEADEKTTLLAYVDYHRATLVRKCDNLTPRQLATRAVPTSTLSLLA